MDEIDLGRMLSVVFGLVVVASGVIRLIARTHVPRRPGEVQLAAASWRVVVGLVVVTPVVLVGLVAVSADAEGAVNARGVPSALAQTYKGDIHFRGGFQVTVVGDRVSSLRGWSGGIPCSAGGRGVGDANPIEIRLRQPVRVASARFSAVGAAATGYGTSFEWILDAAVSARKVAGTLAVKGRNPTGPGTCQGRFRVAAIVPPREALHRLRVTFDGRSGVRFNFKGGVITHLTADANTVCPIGAALDAKLSTTAYRLDPIRVTSGRFRVVTDILDDSGVVTNVSVTGRIRGDSASGTVFSSRGFVGPTGVIRCARRYSWSASSAPPPPVSTAFVDLLPSQYEGRHYVRVRVARCFGEVTEVRFAVAGKAKTVPCTDDSIHHLGPVAPNRRYCVTVTIILRRNGVVIGQRRLPNPNFYCVFVSA